MIAADDDATPINDPDRESISDFSKPHTPALDGPVFLQRAQPLFRRFLEVTLLFRKERKPDSGNRGKAEDAVGQRRFCE